MKPQLPDEDIKILNAVKFHTKQYHSLSSEFINNKILPIISRLQLALDKCVEQRDEVHKCTRDILVDTVTVSECVLEENQELQRILDQK